MIYSKKFDNGLRLIVKKMDGLFSVSTGILVGTGSSFETDEENGISHYIEHMMFKGTQKRTAFEISDAMDRIGAQVNAFTSKEITCYYSKSTYEHTEKAVEILADLFLNSTFPDEEAKKEKGVIIEEIAMTEDTPDDLCLDVLAEAFYGTQNFGRNILGTESNVLSFTQANALKYILDRYSPENVVISMAGNIELEEAERLVEKYFIRFMKSRPTEKREKNIILQHNSLFRSKDIEQVHMAIGYPSIKRADELYNATQLLNTVLGGGMSSRLFQKVREELGLAYSVYSYNSIYEESGMLAVYAGVNGKNVDLAYREIVNVINGVKKGGITAEEFERGKEQIKSSVLFSQESTSAQMLLYGKYLLNANEIFDFNKKINEINALTMDDIRQAIDINFDDSKLALSVVGKVNKPLEF